MDAKNSLINTDTPASIAVDPSGSFVYVLANQGEILEFQINRNSGALTSIGSVPAGNVPMAIVFNPQGTVAYVVNEADNTVWAYTLNKSTGTLQKLAVANTGNSPQAVAVDPLSPTQNFLYVTNNGDNTVSIFGTAGDGAPFFLGSVSTGNSPLSIVLDVAGKFAYVANSSDNTVSEYTINGGTLTSAGIIRARNTPIALALGGGAAAVTYTPKFVYVANGLADTVSQYEVNARGGLKALAGTAATGHYPNSVAVDPTGQFAYVTNSNDNTVSSFRITGSGALLQLGAAVPTGSTPLEIAVDPSGQYAFIVDYGDGAIYEYKIQAGSLTPNGSIPSPGSSAPNAEYACPIPFGGLSAVTVDPTGQYAYVTSPATMSGPGGPTVGNFSPAVICAYSINPQLGTLSLIGSSPPAGFPSTPPVQLLSSAVQEAYPFSIAIDPTGQFAYVADLTYGVVWQLTIDASSGALTLDIPPYPTTPPSLVGVLGGFFFSGRGVVWLLCRGFFVFGGFWFVGGVFWVLVFFPLVGWGVCGGGVWGCGVGVCCWCVFGGCEWTRCWEEGGCWEARCVCVFLGVGLWPSYGGCGWWVCCFWGVGVVAGGWRVLGWRCVFFVGWVSVFFSGSGGGFLLGACGLRVLRLGGVVCGLSPVGFLVGVWVGGLVCGLCCLGGWLSLVVSRRGVWFWVVVRRGRVGVAGFRLGPLPSLGRLSLMLVVATASSPLRRVRLGGLRPRALAGTAICTWQRAMPVPRLPLVAIERASGSVRETCLSGAASTCLPISLRDCICRRRPSIFSLRRIVLASAISPSSRSARSKTLGSARCWPPPVQCAWRPWPL